MINNLARIGSFTSSEIVALTKKGTDGKSFGAAALTYISEANMERRLGRSLETETNVKAFAWGKLVEQKIFDIVGTEYVYCSDQTITHPNIPYWSGSKDTIKYDEGKTVGDFKCPLTLESFCQLVDPLYYGLQGMDAMNAIREGFKDSKGLPHAKHKDGEKFFWQLVSNSILDQTQYGELIVYMPYKSELEEIKLMATQSGDPRNYWIAMATEDELPYLPDGGFYKNINIIRFEVPLQDKIFLGKQVMKAGELLENPSSGLIARRDSEVNAVIIDPLTVPLKKIS